MGGSSSSKSGCGWESMPTRNGRDKVIEEIAEAVAGLVGWLVESLVFVLTFTRGAFGVAALIVAVDVPGGDLGMPDGVLC